MATVNSSLDFDLPPALGVGQQVGELPPLQIDHDRPIATALLPGPVVDADNPCRRVLAALGHMTLEVAQDCVVTLWQPKVGQQALCRTPARGMAY